MATANDLEVTIAPSEAPTRSLIACFPCRKAKVKCGGAQPCKRCASSGTECIYVGPRPSRVAAIDPSRQLVEADGPTLARLWSEIEALQRSHQSLLDSHHALQDDHSELARLVGSREPDGQPARKRRVVEGAAGEDRARLTRPGPSSLRDDSAGRSQGDLVRIGLIPEEQVDELYEAYLTRCSTRISVLLPAPPLPILRKSPHLFSTVLTLALRTFPERAELHSQCYQETFFRLKTASPSTSEERYDYISACLHFSMWYGQTKLGRHGFVEAYEEKMFVSWMEAKAFREAREARGELGENEEEEQVSTRFKLWLMCCAVEQFASGYQFGGSPSFLTPTDFVGTVEEGRARLFAGLDSPAWYYQVCANLELSDIARQSNDYFSPLRHTGRKFDHAALAKISELNSVLDAWTQRWHAHEPTPGQDRNRLVIPSCTVRAYINAFALQDMETADATSILYAARVSCLHQAVNAAVLLLSTALSSATYGGSLPYSIDFVFNNSLSFTGGLLLSACKQVPLLLDLPQILSVLRDTASLLENRAGPRGEAMRAQFTAMQKHIESIAAPPPLPPPAPIDPAVVNGGFGDDPVGLGVQELGVPTLSELLGEPEDRWQELLNGMMMQEPMEWAQTGFDELLF